jgi:hypothetical protein
MSASPTDVTAEIHGFSHPDSTPTPWATGLVASQKHGTTWRGFSQVLGTTP